MSHDPHHDHDDGVEELLRQVGAREEPTGEVADRVRLAVRAEWLLAVEQRKRRRAWTAFGVAASAALIMLFTALILRTISYEPIPAATVARLSGDVRRLAGADGGVALAPGEQIAIGERIATGADGRLALALGANVSVRIDRNSLVAFSTPDRLELIDGAVYVDADPAAAHSKLRIETDAGTVAHLGTQFQVRDLGEAIAVSVREGRVQITHPAGAHTARAGEYVRLTDEGRMERSAVAAHDESWAWAAAAAPGFDIEGRPLSEFLDWAARETGRSVVYRSAAAQQAAADIRLRGSVAHLDPQTALAAVLATTRLQRDQTEPENITVLLASD